MFHLATLRLGNQLSLLKSKISPPIQKEKQPSQLLYTNSQLWALLVPLMIEQFLDSFMGMADTMMVSRVGSTAISAVSLTDSINTLIIQIFIALAAGGTIVCAQYLGQKDTRKAHDAAQQLVLTVLAMSVACSALCILFRRQLLSFVFGAVTSEVMRDSLAYFSITALSYPFFALFQVGGAVYRACGNSRFPMAIGVISNLANIAGNAVLIFILHYGVVGAAVSTLASRILAMFWVLLCLRKDKQEITIRNYYKMRPHPEMIKRVLYVGIPAGVENGMFQFGKLAIQSSVSTLGTTAIAANAMASLFENIDGVAGIGIGIGLMTVIGTCVGAGRRDQAKYYFLKLAFYAQIAITLSCLAMFALGHPAIAAAGMEPDAAKLCFRMLVIITICKPLLWVPSFIPPYGFRAAGDVNFSMIVSSLSMWFCRVALTIFLIRVMHVGIVAVWIGMFTDWGVRGIIYVIRFLSGKWLNFHLA